jgi:beta-lactamase regulating signal transducer with metallopeptidase domain
MLDAMLMALSSAAIWVWIASLKSLVVIALVIVCRQMLGSWLTPQGRHRLWLAAVACLICPVGPSVSLPFLAPPPVSAYRLPTGSEATSNFSALPETRVPVITPARVPAFTPPTLPRRIGIWTWLAVLWASVALVLASLPLRNHLRYRRICNSAVEPDRPITSSANRSRSLTTGRRLVDTHTAVATGHAPEAAQHSYQTCAPARARARAAPRCAAELVYDTCADHPLVQSGGLDQPALHAG